MILNQAAVYIMVGIGSALIDVGLTQLLLSFDVHYLVAVTFGFVVGLVLNFLLHSYFTFKEVYTLKAFARYIFVVLFNFVLVLFFVELFHSWLSSPILGKIVSLPVVAVSGFFLSKYWIYKSDKD